MLSRSFSSHLINSRSRLFTRAMMTSSAGQGQNSKHDGSSTKTPSQQQSPDDYSLQNLRTRMVDFLNKHSSACRLSVAIAGGGGHFLSTLAATPGASKVLLEGTILYDRESYRQYVQLDYDTSNTDNKNDENNNNNNSTAKASSSFRYASPESSLYASQAALDKALLLSAAGDTPLQNMQNSIGMSSASALQSSTVSNNRSKDGSSRSARASRAFVAVSQHGCPPVQLQAKLATHNNKVSSNTSNTETSRPCTRFDEDVFVSHCILTCLEHALEYRQQQHQEKQHQQLPNSKDRDNNFLLEETTIYGDEIQIRATRTSTEIGAETDQVDDDTRSNCVIRNAAERVLRSQQHKSSLSSSPVVLLVPSKGSDNQVGFTALHKSILPSKSLIFPGSFHPPHTGHVQLVQAALEATQTQIVWFELSLTNADKPPLQPNEVVKRLNGFLELTSTLPDHWGVILTNAPLFMQKVELLHPLQVKRSCSSAHPPSLLHFVIGTDTLTRLLDAKYYNSSQSDMLNAIENMQCQFVIGGRLEQKKKSGVFVTGRDEVAQLPPDLQSKFTLLPNFRVDISSTELRQQRESNDAHSANNNS